MVDKENKKTGMTKEIIFDGKYLPKDFAHPEENKVVYIKDDTGLGGTSLFLNDENVTNLIITPNVSQIKSKEGRGYNSHFIYYKSEDTWEDIKKTKKNIYTTYKQLTLLHARNPLLYSYLQVHYRLVVDEYHSILTKNYMGDMHKIVDHIEKFKRVVLTTATDTDVFINPVFTKIPKYRWKKSNPRIKDISIKEDYKKSDVINNVIKNISRGEHTIIFSNNLNVHAKYFEELSTENVVGSILKDKLVRYKDNINEDFDYTKKVHILSSKAYEGMDFLEDTHVLFLTENTARAFHLSKKILEITQGYGRGREKILSATLMIRKNSVVPIWDNTHVNLGRDQSLTSFKYENRHGEIIESMNKSYLKVESELYDDYSNHYLYNEPKEGLEKEGFTIIKYIEPENLYRDGTELQFLSKTGSLKYRINRYSTLEDNLKIPLSDMLREAIVFGKGKFTTSYYEEALMGDILNYMELHESFEMISGSKNTPKNIYGWFLKIAHHLGFNTGVLNTSSQVMNKFLETYKIPEDLPTIDKEIESKISMFVLLYYRKYTPTNIINEKLVEKIFKNKGKKYTKWEYKNILKEYKNTMVYLAMGLSGNESRMELKKKGGRLYSPLTNLISEIRKYIPLQMYEIDLQKFNPTFLAHELKDNVKDSTFETKIPSIYLDNNTDKAHVNKVLNLHVGLYTEPHSDYSTVGGIDSESAKKYLDPNFIKFMKNRFMSIGMNNEEAAYFYKRYFIQKGRFFKNATIKEQEIINVLGDLFVRPTYRLHDAMYAFVRGEITDIPNKIQNYSLSLKILN